MKARWILLVIVLACTWAIGGADEDKVWEFAGGIHGTAAQVREHLNAEVVRLTQSLREAEHNAEEAKASIPKEKSDCLAHLHATAECKQLDTQLAAAKRDLESARATGTTADKMQASSSYNRCAAKLAKLEKEAVGSDRRLDELASEQSRFENKAADIRKSLGEAQAWRENVIHAIRTKYRMPWPPSRTEPELLPDLVVRGKTKTAILADYKCMEEVSRSEPHEGIVDTENIVHSVILLIPEVPNLDQIRPNDTITIDRGYVAASVKAIGGDVCLVLRRAPSPLDTLMKEITAPLDAAQPK